MVAYALVALLVAGAAAPAARWKVTKDKSPMDDSVTVTMEMSATGTIQAWPRQTIRPSLILRCKEGEVSAFVVTGAAPSGGHVDSATIEVRLDDAAAILATVDTSTSHNSLFFRQPESLIRDLAAAKRMVVRFTPFNTSPQVMTFRLAGLKAAIEPLAAACDYEPDHAKAQVLAAVAANAEASKMREEVPGIIASLKSGDASSQGLARIMAFVRLREIGPGAVEAVPFLAQLLKGGGGGLKDRVHAINTLGAIGPGASSTLPELRALIASPMEGIDLALLHDAIRRIDPPAPKPE